MSVAEQAVLGLTWSKIPKTSFLVTWLNYRSYATMEPRRREGELEWKINNYEMTRHKSYILSSAVFENIHNMFYILFYSKPTKSSHPSRTCTFRSSMDGYTGNRIWLYIMGTTWAYSFLLILWQNDQPSVTYRCSLDKTPTQRRTSCHFGLSVSRHSY